MKFNKKETNNFEYTIFGIDLFIVYVYKVLQKMKKTKKNKNNSLFFKKRDIINIVMVP